MVGNRRIRFVIVLDSCCISIGLVFIKDRPVSSFWVLRFRSRVLRFRDLGVFVSSFGCFVFEFWVLRFRDLGASCFGLRFRVLRFRNYPELSQNSVQSNNKQQHFKTRVFALIT